MFCSSQSRSESSLGDSFSEQFEEERPSSSTDMMMNIEMKREILLTPLLR
jgi:hypothetical protein